MLRDGLGGRGGLVVGLAVGAGMESHVGPRWTVFARSSLPRAPVMRYEWTGIIRLPFRARDHTSPH